MALETNRIHHGDARALLPEIEAESVACSVWSPPYHVGKEYEKGVSYAEWQAMLRNVIGLHVPALKPGGFLAINIADILCFPDESMPRIQALNIGRQRSSVTRQDVLDAKAAHPDYNRYQLAALLGCSEQTVDRRLNGNNIRGGKHATQTRVNIVGGFIQEAAMEAGFYPYDHRIWKKTRRGKAPNGTRSRTARWTSSSTSTFSGGPVSSSWTEISSHATSGGSGGRAGCGRFRRSGPMITTRRNSQLSFRAVSSSYSPPLATPCSTASWAVGRRLLLRFRKDGITSASSYLRNMPKRREQRCSGQRDS